MVAVFLDKDSPCVFFCFVFNQIKFLCGEFFAGRVEFGLAKSRIQHLSLLVRILHVNKTVLLPFCHSLDLSCPLSLLF